MEILPNLLRRELAVGSRRKGSKDWMVWKIGTRDSREGSCKKCISLSIFCY